MSNLQLYILQLYYKKGWLIIDLKFLKKVASSDTVDVI